MNTATINPTRLDPRQAQHAALDAAARLLTDLPDLPPLCFIAFSSGALQVQVTEHGVDEPTRTEAVDRIAAHVGLPHPTADRRPGSLSDAYRAQGPARGVGLYVFTPLAKPPQPDPLAPPAAERERIAAALVRSVRAGGIASFAALTVMRERGWTANPADLEVALEALTDEATTLALATGPNLREQAEKCEREFTAAVRRLATPKSA